MSVLKERSSSITHFFDIYITRRVYNFCVFLSIIYRARQDTTPWFQNISVINSWLNCMKGGKEVQALGIKRGGRERVDDVARIIT